MKVIFSPSPIKDTHAPYKSDCRTDFDVKGNRINIAMEKAKKDEETSPPHKERDDGYGYYIPMNTAR